MMAVQRAAAMKMAEQVTFGGPGPDRAGHLRGNADALAAARADPRAAAVLVWRGKPLLLGPALDRLALLPLAHPLLAGDASAPYLLGLDRSGAARFAHDLNGWQPEGLDPAALGSFMDPSEQHHPDLPGDHAFAELRRVMARLSPDDAAMAATAKALIDWHRSHRFCSCCGRESAIILSGWQRRCPDCGANHFPRTDPVVIMLITHGNAVLMGRSPGWPEGMYSLLAGFMEPGETLEAAVRREVHEETGVSVAEVEYLSSQPWPYPSSLMIGCRGRALGRAITLDPVELEDAIWVGRDEMMSAFAGEHGFLKPARSGAIARFLLQNWLADRLE
jgi:NAD+ diphosphatase